MCVDASLAVRCARLLRSRFRFEFKLCPIRSRDPPPRLPLHVPVRAPHAPFLRLAHSSRHSCGSSSRTTKRTELRIRCRLQPRCSSQTCGHGASSTAPRQHVLAAAAGPGAHHPPGGRRVGGIGEREGPGRLHGCVRRLPHVHGIPRGGEPRGAHDDAGRARRVCGAATAETSGAAAVPATASCRCLVKQLHVLGHFWGGIDPSVSQLATIHFRCLLVCVG